MQKSFVEELVEETYGEAFPGRVFDIALIIPVITAIIGIIKSCQESRPGAAKEAMNSRTLGTRIALRRTIRDEHPEMSVHERRELFHASLNRLDRMTEEDVDKLITEADDTVMT